MKVVAAVLAAGKGTRFGSDKALLPLRGRPLWRWSFDVLLAHPEVAEVGVVCSESNFEAIRFQAKEASFVVRGGDTRQRSSRIALETMPPDTEIALLHDAARPFVSPRLISDVIAAATAVGAAAPGVPITDTVREVRGEGSRALDRGSLRAMQTPQGARYDLLLAAHRASRTEHTEDIALLEERGIQPAIVDGDPDNFKITFEGDLKRVSAILGPPETRIGFGYDVHAFATDPDRRLVLGGVPFENAPGLSGHSDADVLSHAVVDALLGALALGDIGTHFPNSSPEWKDRSSEVFVRHATSLVKESGWTVANLDVTVVAERPPIASRAGQIRSRLADWCEVAPERVSVKATTNERLGFIGREEGIAAMAVATIREVF